MTEQTSRAVKAAGEKLYACKVLRDFWVAVPTDETEADGRVRSGKIVEVDADTAMRGVELGTLSRIRE